MLQHGMSEFGSTLKGHKNYLLDNIVILMLRLNVHSYVLKYFYAFIMLQHGMYISEFGSTLKGHKITS